MSPTRNIALEELVSSLEQLRLSRYLCGAAIVIALYDWILQFGDEYLTIWKTNWTVPKAIYYFNRVVTPIGLGVAAFHLTDLRRTPLPPNFCVLYIFINSLTELLSFFLSNLLLTLRLVALYKRKRWLSWFLYTFLVASYAITGLLMVTTLREYALGVHYSVLLHACASTRRSPLMPIIFTIPLAYEFVLFFLTGLRAWQDAKFVTRSTTAPFLYILYRDGIICFLVMFGVRIWNIWIYATQPISSAYLGIYLFWAVMTILYTRVYLNLVFLAHKPTLELSEASRVQFAPVSPWSGAQMQVQLTTVGDGGELVTFGAPGTRASMPLTQFRPAYGIDSTVHSHPNSTWNEPERKGVPASPRPMSRDPPFRPHSSSSFVQPGPL